MDNATIEKGSVVKDSIIGENVRFSGTIKSGPSLVKINGRKIRLRMGAIIGDNVIAENAIIYPGVRIWPGKRITGVVKKDVN